MTPKALTAWSKIGTVEASNFNTEEAYIAVDRHRLDDFTPHLYRTRDGGKTWVSVTEGLVGDGPINTVNVVREDPMQRGLLYAGTERGAYVSFDDGDHWQPLDRNDLPPTSVRDIAVKGDDVVIATHGRGFYIMDDVEPLRELAKARVSATTLFAPATSYRIRPFGFTGTPMPKDEPHTRTTRRTGLTSTTILPARRKFRPGEDRHPRCVGRDGAPLFEHRSRACARNVSKLRLTPDWAASPTAPGGDRGHAPLRVGSALCVGRGRRRHGRRRAGGQGRLSAKPGVVQRRAERRRAIAASAAVAATRSAREGHAADVRRRVCALAAHRGRPRASREGRGGGAGAAQEAASRHGRRRQGASREDPKRSTPRSWRAGGIRGNDGKAELAGTTNLADVSVALRSLSRAADGADGGPTADAQAGAKTQEDALVASLAALDAANAKAQAVLNAPAPAPVSKKKH